MSDARLSGGDVPAPAPTTAGGILRQARQAQGIHVAALAASLKVLPRKLEALEADRYDQLLDATFTRALAQGVCRQLKIDPTPVLSLLPPLNEHRLEQVAEGLKTPFHDGPRRMATMDWGGIGSPVMWLLALIVALTIAVYVLPSRWLPFVGATTSPARLADSNAAASGAASTIVSEAFPPPGATAAIGAAATPILAPGAGTAASSVGAAAVTEPAALATQMPAAAATATTATTATTTTATAAAPTNALQIRTTAPSWVGVTGAQGQSLLSRVVNVGESVTIDGAPPLKLTVGNVRGTEIVFKGRKVDLASADRGNVARLELK